MATKTIKLSYPAADRFIRDYRRLCTGKIFFPTHTPLPLHTRLLLDIRVPDIEQVLSIEGEVVDIIDDQLAAQLKTTGGMMVNLIERPEIALKALNSALQANTDYRMLLNLSDPAETNKTGPAEAAKASDPINSDALSLTWIRTALAQEAAVREQEPVARIGAAAVTEKKQLNPEDQKKARPAGEFLIELTKAMVRSGNYAAGHPGRKQAQQDLYNAFRRCLKDAAEIMIANHHARGQSDILITGILDAPVAVLTLVGSSMAQLFLISLQSYFKRKSLAGFAIKKDITPQHFDCFVDIMSVPVADGGDKAETGSILSRKLIEQGVTEVSTVFEHDLIALEFDMPWPVEMAIQRLAKDLKVRQLARTASEGDIHKIMQPITRDILRSLNHPELQKDLIIHSYLIGQFAPNIEIEDIEEILIDGVPLSSLLPTARLIYEELDRLRKMQADDPDDVILEDRFGGAKRTLQQIARRLVRHNVAGAQRFLKDLYLNQILSFEEIPSDVQYLVNTEKMAQNARSHTRLYVQRILNVKTAEEAAVLLKFARRILPVLIDRADWQTIVRLAEALAEAGETSDLFKNTPGLPTNPLLAVFKGLTDEMITGYENANDAQRDTIEIITGLLGIQGIEILSRVLFGSENRGARKIAMAALTRKGGLVRNWIFKVLEDPRQKWFQKRNALMLLGQIGKYKQDIKHARQLLHHEHPKVRAEALNVVISLQAHDADDAVIAALADTDDKVRWRAMNGLADLSAVSEASVKKLLGLITVEPPEDKEADHDVYHQTAHLIRAIGGFSGIPNREEAEDVILEIARKSSEQKKGLLKRITKTSAPDQSDVLVAAITTLGEIGSTESEAFLAKLARRKSPRAEHARKAANKIKLRNMQQLASDGPQSNVKENQKRRR